MDQNAEIERRELIQLAVNNSAIDADEAHELYDTDFEELNIHTYDSLMRHVNTHIRGRELREQEPERIAARDRLAQARREAIADRERRTAAAIARMEARAGPDNVNNRNNNDRDPEDNNGIGGSRKSKRRKSKRRSRKYFF